MKKQTTAFHGSDLEKIEAIYGIKKENIVNFAANVNPLGFSKKAAAALAADLSVISRYPDPSYKALKEAISQYTNANPENIILGNGVTELLTLFLSMIKPKKAVIVGPTYSEYEKDLNRMSCEIAQINATEDSDFVLTADTIIKNTPEHTDLVILCNPNNPTSGALHKEELTKLVDAYQKSGTFLMIDETYVEFSLRSDDISAAALTNHFDHLIVLRGTSKFFATPGLRLGYALTCNPSLLASASSVQDPWNINSVAETVGSIMFTDREYIHLVRDTMEQEKNYIEAALSKIEGIKTFPVNGNIILAKLPKGSLTSDELFDILIRQGMMIRSCTSFAPLGDRFIRICFMSHEDNVRLMEAIENALKQ
mgnify:FL=1